MALTDNLVAYWKLDGNSNDSVGSINGTNNNITFSSGNGKIIEGAGYNGSSSYITLGTHSALNITTNISICMWIRTTRASCDLFSRAQNSGSYPGYSLSLGSGGVAAGRISFYNGTSWQGSNSTVNSGSWVFVCITNNGTNTIFYINGSVDRTVAQGNPNSYSGNAAIGVRSDGLNASFFLDALDEVGIWNRALSGAEITQLYNGGAGNQYPFTTDYMMLANLGTYTLTGIAAMFKLGKGIVADTGYYLLTGYQAMFHKSISMIVTTGMYVLTGINAILHKNLVPIIAQTGYYVLTGFPALLKRGIKLLANTGYYALTGIQATIRRGRRFVADTGYYILTGQQVAFRLAWKMAMSTGYYALTGIEIIFRKGKLMIANAGYYTLTGIAVILRNGKRMIADTGYYILTGFNAKFPIYWKNAVKNVVGFTNTAIKHVSGWINQDKSNT